MAYCDPGKERETAVVAELARQTYWQTHRKKHIEVEIGGPVGGFEAVAMVFWVLARGFLRSCWCLGSLLWGCLAVAMVFEVVARGLLSCCYGIWGGCQGVAMWLRGYSGWLLGVC